MLEQIDIMPARIKIASILRKAILTGEFASGQELSLTGVAEQLGISRTPVREAFQLLESDGLITLRMNRGAIVNRIDDSYVHEHYEVRAILEGEAVAMACRAGADTQPLRRAHEAMLALGGDFSTERYTEYNQFFHTYIWTASGNHKLYSMLSGLWNGSSYFSSENRLKHQLVSVAEHGAVLEAMERGDGEAARQAMRTHLLRSADNMLDGPGGLRSRARE